MQFSTKAEYGLKAAINLAACFPAQKSLGEISAQEKISLKYLERLMGSLVKGGVVDSFRGKEGGYKLVKKPEKIKAGEIIEILEGPIETRPCNSKECPATHKCASSKVWIELEKQIRKTLYKIKLSDLINY